ncbi:MAG: hypothetical protein GY754_02660 [bacterium]|nr:hypothetical protein [bacterium]
MPIKIAAGLFVGLCVFPLVSLMLFAEVKAPDEPAVPDVFLNKNTKKTAAWYPVRIDFANKKYVEENLLFSSGSISFIVVTKGKTQIRKVAVSDISTLEFLKWKGEKINKKTYRFYPAKIRVTLKDKSAFLSKNPGPVFNRLTVEAKKKRMYYSYFYEYRVKGKWEYSKKKETGYPETHPHKETVVKIRFKKVEKKTGKGLEKLFLRYLK